MAGQSIYAKVVGDILHAGHVRFFRAARELGSHLTVCVVGDERVAAYKGRPPLQTQAERMEVIGACRWVDAVIGDGPKVIDRAFMARHGFDVYAFGASDERELAVKLADCADLPEHMRVRIAYTPGVSSSALWRRIAGSR
ncbi:adenylyltransferase/cytidyltransferase family protein [Microbaculum marinum]|uniref:ethanolamine-phosphate cytidylyltransferase n=1 Tax=Microbaculum marinum TaxID=1764581 RepID=A0AAW9RWQ6_9HYPH